MRRPIPQESGMATIERDRGVSPSLITERDQEMARVAQRCIMESLDRSKAAE